VQLGPGQVWPFVKAILEAHGTAFGVYSLKEIKTSFWFELDKYQEA